jgi:hypothetical protein
MLPIATGEKGNLNKNSSLGGAGHKIENFP